MKYTRFLTALLALVLCTVPVIAGAQTHSCYIGCEWCLEDWNCPVCSFCTAVTATARPAVPSQENTCEPTPVQTPSPVPVQTPRPTSTPAATQKPVTPAPIATQTPAPTKTPAASNGDYTTISISKQEEIVFELLNRDRAQNGLPALVLDPELCRIARIKSQDMNDNNYFAHESPTYGRVGQMLNHFGYAFNGAGENIAHHATVEKAQAAFMSSTGHRANILGKQWQKVGIGVVYDDQGFVYVTQIFVR